VTGAAPYLYVAAIHKGEHMDVRPEGVGPKADSVTCGIIVGRNFRLASPSQSGALAKAFFRAGHYWSDQHGAYIVGASAKIQKELASFYGDANTPGGKRDSWTWPGGRFIKVGPNWQQRKLDGSLEAVWKEADRTREYVEIHLSSGQQIRLHQGKAEWRSSGSPTWIDMGRQGFWDK
jgi:hypothetical protein